MARFRTLQPVQKSRFSLKRRTAFQTGAKIYLSAKYLGLGALIEKKSIYFAVELSMRKIS